jgi:hypothetical protein
LLKLVATFFAGVIKHPDLAYLISGLYAGWPDRDDSVLQLREADYGKSYY